MGCAAAPRARNVGDVSGFKAEIAGLGARIGRIEYTANTRIGKIEKTTNVDRWTFFGAVVVVPLVLSYLFMRATRRYATCEAKKHGYWEQRRARMEHEIPSDVLSSDMTVQGQTARWGKTSTREPFKIEDDTEPEKEP